MILKNQLMSWKLPKMLMRNWAPLSLWLGLFVISVLLLQSCNKSGPAITGCVVDIQNKGFQCLKYPKTKFFLPFGLGLDLGCSSPQDTEEFLKACERHQIIEIPECHLTALEDHFECIDGNEKFSLELEEADNYFCVNELNRRRIIDRCSEQSL